MKTFYLALVGLLLSVSLQAQTGTCADPFLLSPGTPVTGTTVGADNADLSGDCLFFGTPLTRPTRWFSYTPSTTVVAQLLLTDGANFTITTAYTGACSDLMCAPDFKLTSTTTDDRETLYGGIFTAVAGQTYRIPVLNNLNPGDFTLSLVESPVPGTTCATAPLLTEQNVVYTALSSAAGPVAEFPICRADIPTGEILTVEDTEVLWYRYTAPADADVIVINGCAGLNTERNISVAVFRDGCDALSCVGGAGEFGFDVNGICGNASSTLEFAADPGQTYLLAFYKLSTTDEVLDFQIQGRTTGIPNDRCRDALPIELGTPFSGTIVGASAESIAYEPGGNCGSPSFSTDDDEGVWYSFTATTEFIRIAQDPSSTYTPSISLHTGTCEALRCVREETRPRTDGGSDTIRVTVGTEYLLYVEGFGSEVGAFTLTVDDVPPPQLPYRLVGFENFERYATLAAAIQGAADLAQNNNLFRLRGTVVETTTNTIYLLNGVPSSDGNYIYTTNLNALDFVNIRGNRNVVIDNGVFRVTDDGLPSLDLSNIQGTVRFEDL